MSEQSPQAGEWVLVPRIPDDGMTRAGDQHTNCGGECGNRSARATWQAMLAAAPAAPPSVSAARIAALEKALAADRMHWFLTILVGMGGSSGTDDDSWLDTFCDDGEPDTFNRAIEVGYTRTTHDDRFDASTVYITEAGRSLLSTKEGDNG